MKIKFLIQGLILISIISCSQDGGTSNKEIKTVELNLSDKECLWEEKEWTNYIRRQDILDLEKIDYEFRCIDEFPKEIFEFSNLRYLSLSVFLEGKKISPEIGKLSNLDTLILSKSKIKTLPKEIEQLSKLKYLFIGGGQQLEEIPKEIGNCKELKEIVFWRNNLKSLPEEIENLKKLKVLNLIENHFSEEERERIKKILPNCEIKFEY